jgi:hypothetical protein
VRGIRVVARAGDGVPERIVDVAETPAEADMIVDHVREYEAGLDIYRPIETEPDT